MAIPRNSALSEDPLPGSALPITVGPVRVVTALEIACPALDCEAEAKQPCTTGRLSRGRRTLPLTCRERIEIARVLRDQGELTVTEVKPAGRCRLCATVHGRIRACPAHECQWHSCELAVEPASKFCVHHSGRTGGRAKVTEATIDQMRQLRADGKTVAQIAAALGVSVMTVHNHVRQPIDPGTASDSR